MNRVGRVIVFAADMTRLRVFYTAILGEPSETEHGWVGFANGLALHAIPPAYAPAIAEPPVARTDTAIKVVFIVDDLPAMRAVLAARGATMREPQTYGARTFCDGVDPEGNVFQIANA